MIEILIAIIAFLAGTLFGTYMENRHHKQFKPNLKWLRLTDDEILAMSYPQPLSAERFQKIKSLLEAELPEHLKGKIVLMDSGAELHKQATNSPKN